jgi:hypothetical protein
MGNIGNAYYKKGDHASALPYLEADFHLSIAHNIIGSAVNVSMMLANVELERGNLAKSREYIQYNRDNIDTNILGCRIVYAENMYLYSKRIQDYRAAVGMPTPYRCIQRDRKNIQQRAARQSAHAPNRPPATARMSSASGRQKKTDPPTQRSLHHLHADRHRSPAASYAH